MQKSRIFVAGKKSTLFSTNIERDRESDKLGTPDRQ